MGGAMSGQAREAWVRLLKRPPCHGWGDTDPNPAATERYYAPVPRIPRSGSALAKRRAREQGAFPQLNSPRLVR